MPRDDPALYEALRRLTTALERHQTQYAIIGGVATIAYLPARLTDDVDVLAVIPQMTLPGLLDDLAARGFTVQRDSATREWVQHRMTSFRFGAIVIDCMQPVIPLYGEVLKRATHFDLRGQRVRLASPEGLILTKLLADRPQDWEDIEALITILPGRLDLGHMESQWTTVADTGDPRWQRFQRLLASPAE